ncbi:GNAT family N-acetyltransferase [uncultured Roseibium sp.]|uniref:GNAT family N-acetyltransferase n=1 Tax=uncultured Roseibium sp. TaxID=1936171 RepID=UPI00262F2161|nr:GNAT family N-acetyltransferase [uncultured Roseibium sp.]
MKKLGLRANIREAVLQDLLHLKQCIDRAYAADKARIKNLPDVSGGLEDDICSNTVLVAEADGRLAGCAIFSVTGPDAHLINLAVDPDFMGQGLGRQLVEATEKEAFARGATEIHLATHPEMLRNVSLYSHLGWSETSRNENKILMQKKLM